MSEEKDYKLLANHVKDGLSIFRVLDYYGCRYISESFPHNISCPILGDGHSSDDRRPSCKVFPESSILHCFCCGFHGGVIDVIMVKEGIRFREAVDFAIANFGVKIKDVSEWKSSIRRKLNLKNKPDFTNRDCINLVYLAMEKIREWEEVLIPLRVSLFIHLLTEYYMFEYQMDSLMDVPDEEKPDLIKEFSHFVDRCKALMNMWRSKSFDDFMKEGQSVVYSGSGWCKPVVFKIR